jgi:hypothetical protein
MSDTGKEIVITVDGNDMSVLLNYVVKPKAQVIFAHGAGADMSHEFMEDFTLLLNKNNINVTRFNFPFMDKRRQTQKKYPPDRMPKLLNCYQAIIDYVSHQQALVCPLFIGGKSMGSRVAVTLMADENYRQSASFTKVQAVFCLGYPFHPPKKPEKLRLTPLIEAKKPTLIIQGQRDTLGNQTEISGYGLAPPCQIIFLADGDHSLKPRVKSGFTYAGHMITAAEKLCNFISVHSKLPINIKNITLATKDTL